MSVNGNPPIGGVCRNCGQRIRLTTGWVHTISGRSECPLPPVQPTAEPVPGDYSPKTFARWVGDVPEATW